MLVGHMDVVTAADVYTSPFPEPAWSIPPQMRHQAMTDEAIQVYVECELPLSLHYQTWIWLHNQFTWDEVRELLAREASTCIA